jgi:hypothetical protein
MSDRTVLLDIRDRWRDRVNDDEAAAESLLRAAAEARSAVQAETARTLAYQHKQRALRITERIAALDVALSALDAATGNNGLILEGEYTNETPDP